MYFTTEARRHGESLFLKSRAKREILSQRQASRWRVHVRKNYLYQDAHCKNQNANRIADQTMSFEELLLFVRTRQTMANANDTAQITVNQPGTIEPIWLSL